MQVYLNSLTNFFLLVIIENDYSIRDDLLSSIGLHWEEVTNHLHKF